MFIGVKVLVGDLRSLDDDLSDLAVRSPEIIAPRRDRSVVDPDDGDLDGRHRVPDAGPGAAIGRVRGSRREDHIARVHRHRERLGGAVGGQDPTARGHQGDESLDDPRRHRRAGGHDLPERRQLDAVIDAIPPDGVEQRRRTEHGGHTELVDGPDDLPRIDLRRPGRVHVGDDRRHPERRVEERKEREGGQIHIARTAVENPTNRLDLGGEVAVAVDHALGRTGAARGEDDGGDLVARWSPAISMPPASRPMASIFASVRPPQKSRGPTVTLVRTVARAQPRITRAAWALGTPMKASGRALPRHALRWCSPMPGIHQHRHRAGSEDPEGEDEEIEAGRDHQNGPDAATDPRCRETRGHPRGPFVEFAIGQGPAATAPGTDDGGCLGLALGHVADRVRDVDRCVHRRAIESRL